MENAVDKNSFWRDLNCKNGRSAARSYLLLIVRLRVGVLVLAVLPLVMNLFTEYLFLTISLASFLRYVPTSGRSLAHNNKKNIKKIKIISEDQN